MDAAGTHRTQLSRHVGDISRAKESLKPLAFAKERHSRSGYSTADRQKSKRRMSDGSDQEPLALPSRAEAGRTLRSQRSYSTTLSREHFWVTSSIVPGIPPTKILTLLYPMFQV